MHNSCWMHPSPACDSTGLQRAHVLRPNMRILHVRPWCTASASCFRCSRNTPSHIVPWTCRSQQQRCTAEQRARIPVALAALRRRLCTSHRPALLGGSCSLARAAQLCAAVTAASTSGLNVAALHMQRFGARQQLFQSTARRPLERTRQSAAVQIAQVQCSQAHRYIRAPRAMMQSRAIAFAQRQKLLPPWRLVGRHEAVPQSQTRGACLKIARARMQTSWLQGPVALARGQWQRSVVVVTGTSTQRAEVAMANLRMQWTPSATTLTAGSPKPRLSVPTLLRRLMCAAAEAAVAARRGRSRWGTDAALRPMRGARGTTARSCWIRVPGQWETHGKARSSQRTAVLHTRQCRVSHARQHRARSATFCMRPVRSLLRRAAMCGAGQSVRMIHLRKWLSHRVSSLCQHQTVTHLR